MTHIGDDMKMQTGRTKVQNEGGQVEVRKTGIGRNQGRGGGREMLKRSENGGESLAMTA